MAEYKNQHYVPKFLLRGWTDDEKVFPYHIENRAEYPKTSISNLCSDDYFYGDPEIEKSLNPLETRHKEIVEELRDTKSFPTLDAMDIQYFCVFVLLQRNRTKETKEQAEENIDNLAKEFIRTKIESGEVENKEFGGKTVLERLDNVKITRDNPLSLPILMALTGVEQILDLEVALIVNNTEKEFIISDHPVAHDNKRFKNEADRFLVGIQSKGLQMFVPLADDLQVMLYDPSSYLVDYSDKAARRVTTDSVSVIKGLNDLQLINAHEAVYYRNSGKENEFNDACDRLFDHMEADKTIFQRLGPDEHPFETENEIIESGQQAPTYSPTLPFVKQRKEASFAVMRNRKVAKQHKEFVNEILEEAREEQKQEDEA